MNENYLTLEGENVRLHGFCRLNNCMYVSITVQNRIVLSQLPTSSNGYEVKIDQDSKIIRDDHLYHFLNHHRNYLNKRFIYNEISSSYYPTDIQV